MGVTMKDIARDLGVSVVTVSKVLRKHSDISPETRQRVLRRMKELNYQPNQAARSLVTGRSYAMGLIVPDLEHPFFGEIAKAISRRIRLRDYSLIIASSEEDPLIERREIEGLIARQVDAIVLASVQTSAQSGVFQRLAESRVPYVLIDRNFPGLAANYVGVDDTAVGRAATEHLIARGCRRIAHLRGPEVSTGIGRLQGYRETLTGAGMEVPLDYVVDLKSGDDRSEERGYEGMTRLLALRNIPDGVFCYNDEVAIGALRAILEAGMRIPADIAVIGVDNIRFADLLRVPLSSVDQNTYQIGERAAQLALKLIESKTAPPRQIILSIRLIARESTGAGATPGHRASTRPTTKLNRS
jgi:LacI family transcriptional regulator